MNSARVQVMNEPGPKLASPTLVNMQVGTPVELHGVVLFLSIFFMSNHLIGSESQACSCRHAIASCPTSEVGGEFVEMIKFWKQNREIGEPNNEK